MSFSSLIEKLVNGEGLSPDEKQEMVLQARRLEQAEQLLSSVILPGTRIIRIDGLEAINAEIESAIIRKAVAGDVELNNDGLRVRFGGVYGITFEDSSGGNGIRIVSSSGNQLQLQNNVGPIELMIELTDESTPLLQWRENPTNATQLNASTGPQGGKVTVDGEIGIYGEGSSGGATYLQMAETSTEPGAPTGVGVHTYLKGGYFVIKFNNSAYYYLDLNSGSGTWSYSATAP